LQQDQVQVHQEGIMFHRKSFWVIGGLAVFIPVAAVVWWLASPLFINRTVQESFPLSNSALVPTGMTQAEVEQELAETAKTEQPADEALTTEMASAEVIKSGAFHDGDSFHKGSGQAAIYRQPDGSLVLRLEDFEVTNGPDLHVLLSENDDPAEREAVMNPGYVDLGSLKGNIGNQNYTIPGDVDVESIHSVVIYCLPFHVVFSVAPLS
jgi:hypothetical protein